MQEILLTQEDLTERKTLTAEAWEKIVKIFQEATEDSVVALPEGLMILNLDRDTFETLAPFYDRDFRVTLKLPSTIIGLPNTFEEFQESLYILAPSCLKEACYGGCCFDEYSASYYDCEKHGLAGKVKIHAHAKYGYELDFKAMDSEDAQQIMENEYEGFFECKSTEVLQGLPCSDFMSMSFEDVGLSVEIKAFDIDGFAELKLPGDEEAYYHLIIGNITQQFDESLEDATGVIRAASVKNADGVLNIDEYDPRLLKIKTGYGYGSPFGELYGFSYDGIDFAWGAGEENEVIFVGIEDGEDAGWGGFVEDEDEEEF